MSFTLQGPLLLAGAGRMGGAILSRLLASGLDPRLVLVQDPEPPVEVADLIADACIDLLPFIDELTSPPAVILLAVKPQLTEEVLPGLARLAGPGTLLLSIVAGRRLAGLAVHMPEGAAIVRAMPNTPAAIGRGITVAVGNARVRAPARKLAHALLAATGAVEWVDDEALMNAVTAVSGSGPAYVFLLAEAMARAGAAAGLPAALSEKLARETVAGAGELLHRSPLPAATLRSNVTSPGGTTAAALDVLMGRDGLDPLMTRAVAAATRRGKDLAG